MNSTELVLDILKTVIHPAKGKSIIELGMVEDLNCQTNSISMKLIFTKPTDPFISSLQKAILKAIENKLGSEINVRIEIKKPEVKEKVERAVLPNVQNIIAIASGKGGVGKSTVSSNLAISLANMGFKVGLLDADIYGPSQPKMFGEESAQPGVERRNGVDYIQPVVKYGVKVLSIGFFVKPKDATIWRGPMATSALKQLIQQGDWGELDFLLIDLPPGTGDIHLTMVQEIPVTGAVIVSTPQQVALADVVKGITMFKNSNVNVPVLGLIENMAWFTPRELPDAKYFIFGNGGCKKLADAEGLALLGQIPLIQGICEGGDSGKPAVLNDQIITDSFHEICLNLLKALENRVQTIAPTKKVEISRK